MANNLATRTAIIAVESSFFGHRADFVIFLGNCLAERGYSIYCHCVRGVIRPRLLCVGPPAYNSGLSRPRRIYVRLRGLLLLGSVLRSTFFG
jgi:hypothetical protein